MSKIFRIRREGYFSDPRMVVAVARQKGQQTMGLHRHEFLEIAVVVGGQGSYTTPQGKEEIRPGDVMVVNSRHSHGYDDTHDLELANVLVREDLLREVERDLGALPGYHALFTLEPVRRRGVYGGHVRLSPEDLRQVSGWIAAMEQESRRPTEGGHFLARAWLVLLVGFLARCYGRQRAGADRLDRRLGRVLASVDMNPEKAFSLGDMAAEAAMSERSFLREFRKATGFSPMDYVIRARVRCAERMLAEPETGRSITDIALACGFNDSNYFSRQFRRVSGRTPRSWRRGR